MNKKSYFKILFSLFLLLSIILISACKTSPGEMCSVKFIYGHGIKNSIVTVEKGSTLTLPHPVVQENLAFCCWSEDDYYYTNKLKITENHTFYAEWIPTHTGFYGMIIKDTYDKLANNYYTRANPNGGINVKGLIPSTPITDPKSIYYGIDFSLPENNIAMAAFYLGYSGTGSFSDIRYYYNLEEIGDRDGLDIIYLTANPGFYFDLDLKKGVPLPEELYTITIDFDKKVTLYSPSDNYYFENTKDVNKVYKLPELYCCANLVVDDTTGEYIAQK